MTLRNTYLPAQQRRSSLRDTLQLHRWNTGKKEEEKSESKSLFPVTSFTLRDASPPSSHGVHAFSSELALADGVAGAPGGAGTHVTVNTLGTPRTFFPCRVQTRSHQQIFLLQMWCKRRQPQETSCRKKTRALTFHNRRARVVLGVNPDRFVVIFTQHIVVPILAFRPKFAICKIEQRAGGWVVWRRDASRTPAGQLERFQVSTG